MQNKEKKVKKIRMGKNWSEDKKEKLVGLINKEIKKVQGETTRLREIIHSGAPVFKKKEERIEFLNSLLKKLKNHTAAELRVSRKKFSEFIV